MLCGDWETFGRRCGSVRRLAATWGRILTGEERSTGASLPSWQDEPFAADRHESLKTFRERHLRHGADHGTSVALTTCTPECSRRAVDATGPCSE
jgi:hypothetical protein